MMILSLHGYGSAVIFLYSGEHSLASVAVANMDDAVAYTAPACAMSVLIVLTNMVVRSVYNALTRKIKRRSQAWTST